MKEFIRFCPVSMGSEVLADRWTPLIVRELVLGNTRFNDIARGLPGISRSLLVRRLRSLERVGVIERSPVPSGHSGAYRLTPAGRDLERVLTELGRWSIEWLYHEMRPRDLDAVTLMWWMHRRVDHEQLPVERVVVEFVHTAPVRQQIWLVVEDQDCSVCIQHPGYESDVVVACATPVLSAIFNGLDTWDAEVLKGTLVVTGPRRLTRDLPRWFLWGLFPAEMRAAEQRAQLAL